ncbi:hypothetical protein [Arenimonas caeni]|uniref:hypothetical protein n=1 Tax=Arenimonas caeni TaxID=2058085 RepID=UPI0013B04BD4|nr:hypothetical protein [Arenimonas caeni]
MIPLGILGGATPRAAGGGGATYATLNPSDKSASITLSGGNLIATGGVNSSGVARSVQAISGKRYFEAVMITINTGVAVVAAGVATSAHSLTASLGYANPNGWAFWGRNTGARHNGATAIARTSASGDVFGFAVDEPNGKLWIRQNGSWIQGDPETDTNPIWSNLSGTLYAAACPWGSGTTSVTVEMRFDPATFSIAAPAGFDPMTA